MQVNGAGAGIVCHGYLEIPVQCLTRWRVTVASSSVTCQEIYIYVWNPGRDGTTANLPNIRNEEPVMCLVCSCKVQILVR